MKSIHQTYRRRLRAAFGVLLMLLSGLLLGLSAAQYSASQEALRKLENDFSYIAVPSSLKRFRFQYMGSYEDRKKVYIAELSREAQEFLELLPERVPQAIEGVSRSSMVTAYCPDLNPLQPRLQYDAWLKMNEHDYTGQTPPRSRIFDPAHETAVLEITFAQAPVCSETPFSKGVLDVRALGVVSKVISMPAGYDDPAGRNVEAYYTVSLDAQKEEVLHAQPGDKFLIAGEYIDRDLNARMYLHYMTGEAVPLEAFDWAFLAVDPMLTDSMGNSNMRYDAEHPEMAGGRVYISIPAPYIPDGCTVTGTGLFSKIPAGGTAEEVLQEPQWQERMEQTEAKQHGFPVLAPENLDHMALFATQGAEVPQGRYFTEQEYAEGAPVCLISETLAAANGLKIGDSIRLALYPARLDDRTIYDAQQSNPLTYEYDLKDSRRQQTAYTIVGLYRQANEWSLEHGSFTPNTILVPQKSVQVQTREGVDGCLATLKIKRGKELELEEYLKEEHYSGLLQILDRDFSTISPSAAGYAGISGKVFAIGVGLWLLILALFMLLFPMQEGKNLNRMWALGAEKKQMMGHVILGSGSVLLPGAVLGFVGSALAAEKFGQIVAQLAKSEEPLKISISSLAAASTVSFLVQLLILTVIAFFMSRKRREDFK